MSTTIRTYQPALVGGLFIGVLSSLPYVSSANACCCLWVVTGGLITVYLLQQRTPLPVETADAVLSGLLAGVIGAVICVVVTAALLSIMGPFLQERIRAAIDENPQMPADARDMLLNLFAGRSLVFLLALVSLPVFAIFSALGALLGLAIFRKKTPPAPPAGPAAPPAGGLTV